MIARLVFAFLYLSSVIANGQISIAAFLNSASSDPEVKTFYEQQKYLGQKPYQLSPLQRLEFRTQNREMLAHQQEFSLRLTPSNPWEVRNNNLYFKSYQSVLALQYQIALREALTDRYTAVIEYLYYKELKEHLVKTGNLIRDQLEILQKQSGSSYFDADDFVDLQLDLMDKSVEMDEADFELMNRYHMIEQLYSKPISDSLSWSFSELITLEHVQMITDSISYSAAASVLEAYQKQRIQLASSEYKLEKANINTGFLQGEFDNRRQEQGRTPFNISLGITIPIVNPNKGDMAKRQLDVIEAQYDLDETTSEEASKNVIFQDQVSRLVQRHRGLSTKVQEYENGTLSGILSTLQKGDPRVTVQFNENLIKMKILVSKLKRDALLNYIYYLGVSDKLEQQPLRNYLSDGLERID